MRGIAHKGQRILIGVKLDYLRAITLELEMQHQADQSDQRPLYDRLNTSSSQGTNMEV